MRAFFLILATLSLTAFADERDVLSLDWSKHQTLTISEMFAAVRLTPSGRELEKNMLPLHSQGKLRILLLSGGNLPKEWAERTNLNGAYSEGLLFVDDTLPMLSLVGTFFHELTHAQDSLLTLEGQKRSDLVVQFRKSAKSLLARIKNGEEISEEEQRGFFESKGQVDSILLEDEWRAYRAQDKFMKELIELNGEFDSMLKKQINDKVWIAYPITDGVFRKLMVNPKGLALPAPVVDEFLKNN